MEVVPFKISGFSDDLVEVEGFFYNEYVVDDAAQVELTLKYNGDAGFKASVIIVRYTKFGVWSIEVRQWDELSPGIFIDGIQMSQDRYTMILEAMIPKDTEITHTVSVVTHV